MMIVNHYANHTIIISCTKAVHQIVGLLKIVESQRLLTINTGDNDTDKLVHPHNLINLRYADNWSSTDRKVVLGDPKIGMTGNYGLNLNLGRRFVHSGGIP